MSQLPEKPRRGRPWVKGQSGNPSGRKGPNKITRALKEIVLGALDRLGGEEYLVRVAKHDPAVFCALLQKIIPADMTAVIESKSVDLTDNTRRIQEALRAAGLATEPSTPPPSITSH